ncbi:WYL domain-containing protein [Gemmiger formicilis]|uniref:helix-turn-helix transcriptional regulator n=1 Tax=Gemmiger formicilis TaxID=745368 RepID=UPI0019596814|nr:WYL domain-containing protein [Gemmiger formicilis]MBM6715797.1 WYL domain-containing protein [Gemmiger formicilis]
MAEDKIYRLLALQQLLSGNTLNKKEAAARFEVGEKSIQRDLETLRAYYAGQGNDLLYDREANCYRLEQPAEARLTKSEVLAVCKILLESRAFTEKELDPILNKLVACCTPVQNLRAVQELIGNERFHYVPPHHGKAFVDKLWTLGEAIRDHKVVEMDYVGTHNAVPKHRRVQPVGILFSEYYFYLAAFIEGIDKKEHFANPEDRSPTIYRVDRIGSFTVTNDHFDIPYKDRFQEGEMRKRIQFMYGGKLRHIKFKYTGPNIEAVLDRLPTARVLEELPEGGQLVEAEVFDGNGLDMWLRSQGDWVKTLA